MRNFYDVPYFIESKMIGKCNNNNNNNNNFLTVRFRFLKSIFLSNLFSKKTLIEKYKILVNSFHFYYNNIEKHIKKFKFLNFLFVLKNMKKKSIFFQSIILIFFK